MIKLGPFTGIWEHTECGFSSVDLGLTESLGDLPVLWLGLKDFPTGDTALVTSALGGRQAGKKGGCNWMSAGIGNYWGEISSVIFQASWALLIINCDENIEALATGPSDVFFHLHLSSRDNRVQQLLEQRSLSTERESCFIHSSNQS